MMVKSRIGRNLQSRVILMIILNLPKLHVHRL
jgi:hypothetical protein